jgi:hypothetical protein
VIGQNHYEKPPPEMIMARAGTITGKDDLTLTYFLMLIETS